MDSSSKLLRIDEVSKLTTLAKSTIWLKVSQQAFPPPIRLSPAICVWRASSIEGWIDSHMSKAGGNHG